MAENDITKLGEAMAAVDKDIRQEVGPRRFPPQVQASQTYQTQVGGVTPLTLPQWLRQLEQRAAQIEKRLEKLERWLGVEG